MGNLVRHHPGEFGFVVGGKNQPGIHVKKSPRKRERIYIV
jgi:hypothetical protein